MARTTQGNRVQVVAAANPAPQRRHTVSAPAFHPPYEAQIDLRIPLHFTRQSNNHRFYYNDDEEREDRVMDLSAKAFTFARSLGICARLSLCRALAYNPDASESVPDDSPFWSPLYWVVTLLPEEVGRWREVHQTLRDMVVEAFVGYPEFSRDPPMRYFVNETEYWE